MKFKSPEKINHTDVAIIGGGCVGVGLFRDLSLHGVPCALIDARDFSSQTSSRSSKMLHGGIRYLENLDFDLVKEALMEKNQWLKMAPHLCYERDFVLPIYKDSVRPKWMIYLGLVLYDFLSAFKNSPYQILSAKEAKNKIPQLREQGLKGAGLYHDAIVDDCKMTLECLYDGLLEKNSHAYNYTVLKKLTKKNEFHLLHLEDHLTGEVWQMTCKRVVFATGPFTDQLLAELNAFPWSPKLLPSKGSHLWFKKEDFPIPSPVVLTPKDGRVIFVIPQEELVLVGTTEKEVCEDFFDIEISPDEVNYLLQCLQEFFPENPLSAEQIHSTFAGIRPLVRDDGSVNRGQTAREHKVFYPANNIHVILGGKYTTFRSMVQELAREIVVETGPYSPDKTLAPFRQHSLVPAFQKSSITRSLIESIIANEYPRTINDIIERRLGAQNPIGEKELLEILGP